MARILQSVSGLAALAGCLVAVLVSACPARADGQMMASEQEWRRTLERSLGIPATEGKYVEVLRDGVTVFPAMLEAIESVPGPWIG